MKKIYLVASVLVGMLSLTQVNAQVGLEGIVVEKYYISDASDSTDAADNGSVYPLHVGSTTYRVYADLQTGYSLIQLFGSEQHPWQIGTTTSFFNDPNWGVSVYQGTSVNNTKKNTQLIDSYITIGGVANGLCGVLKTEDTDGTIGNNQGVLANVDPAAGAPITGGAGVDGLMPGAPILPNVLGITSELDLFDQTAGGTFNVVNGAVAALGGMQGVTASNMVLIGQFTTDGVFTFKMNLQLGTPTAGGSEIWVAENPLTGEFQDSTLIYTSQPDTTGIGIDVLAINGLSLYPNPTQDVLYVGHDILKGQFNQLVISDLTGRVAFQSPAFGRQSNIDVSAFAKGVYVVSLVNDSGSISKRFIKE
ncbi:MAG: Secretion system C-terminal sorting domain [Bacteroidota bacterium]